MGIRRPRKQWLDDAAQERLIRWFGTREQVIGFVLVCLGYTGIFAVAWFNPWHWPLLVAAHLAIEDFAVFGAAVFAPMMTYFTWESELLNRLLIMKAERSEGAQAAQDATLLHLLRQGQERDTTLLQMLDSLQQIVQTMQAYDKDDAQDLDVVREFVESIGPDFPAKLAAIMANHQALGQLIAEWKAGQT